ncbi:MAG: hypothetical protein ACI9EK_001999, partial [Psychroserpens sp.]
MLRKFTLANHRPPNATFVIQNRWQTFPHQLRNEINFESSSMKRSKIMELKNLQKIGGV